MERVDTERLCVELASVALKSEVIPYLPFGCLERVQRWLAQVPEVTVHARSCTSVSPDGAVCALCYEHEGRHMCEHGGEW